MSELYVYLLLACSIGFVFGLGIGLRASEANGHKV